MSAPKQIEWVPEVETELLEYLERQSKALRDGIDEIVRICSESSKWQRVDVDVFALRVASLESENGNPESLVAIDFDDVDAQLTVLLGVAPCSLAEVREHISTIEYRRRINTAVGCVVRNHRFAWDLS